MALALGQYAKRWQRWVKARVGDSVAKPEAAPQQVGRLRANPLHILFRLTATAFQHFLITV
jgi:hypothetical protein